MAQVAWIVPRPRDDGVGVLGPLQREPEGEELQPNRERELRQEPEVGRLGQTG